MCCNDCRIEFDMVHYPLPLQFEQSPSPAALQRTVARLRRKLEASRARQQEGGDASSSDKERYPLPLSLSL